MSQVLNMFKHRYLKNRLLSLENIQTGNQETNIEYICVLQGVKFYHYISTFDYVFRNSEN